MNSERSVNTRRLIVILIVLLLVSMAVLFWMREIIREVIVLPLSYLLFVAGIMIDTTPQLFFWLALLMIAFWIAYRSLRSKRRPAAHPAAPVLDEMSGRFPSSGRVSYWTNKVNQMRRYNSSYYQGTFNQSLARLLVELLAHRYRLTMLQAEDRLRSGELEVPADVREYVLAGLSRMEPVRQKFLTKLWMTIVDTFQRLFSFRVGKPPDTAADRPGSQSEAQIARVIHYMEEELEVSHDHASQ